MMKEIKRIVFTKPNTAEYLVDEKIDFDDIPENFVVVKSHFTTLSAGTERANLVGSSNVGPKGAKAIYPIRLGYNCAGEVVKVGKKVESIKVGDRVVVYWSVHANYNIVPENRVVKIEYDNISYEQAAISFISTFPLAAIRKTRLEIGESLMVMGLGILGQIAIKLAKIGGACPIIACDPIKERREEALKYGLIDKIFDKRPSNK